MKSRIEIIGSELKGKEFSTVKQFREAKRYVRGVDTIVTHDSVYHTDDVFSTALVKIIHGVDTDLNIIRTRNPEVINHHLESNTSLVFDVGGGAFDHHTEREERDGVPYASFGKLWRLFGSMLSERGRNTVLCQLVYMIDGTDNQGLEVCPNPLAYSLNALRDNGMSFEDAVNWAVPIMRSIIKREIDLDIAETECRVADCNEVAMLPKFNKAISTYRWSSNVKFVAHPDFDGKSTTVRAVNGNKIPVGCKDSDVIFIHLGGWIAKLKEGVDVREWLIRHELI